MCCAAADEMYLILEYVEMQSCIEVFNEAQRMHICPHAHEQTRARAHTHTCPHAHEQTRAGARAHACTYTLTHTNHRESARAHAHAC